MSVGAGAAAAFFSVVRQAFVSPFGYDAPEELVIIRATNPNTHVTNYPLSFSEFTRVHSAGPFVPLAAYQPAPLVFTADGIAQRVDGARTSAELFAVLGASPILGRVFSPEDERIAPQPVIISERLWATMFNRNPDVLSRQVVVDGASATVVGIMPEAVRDPFGLAQDCWVLAAPGAGGVREASRGWIVVGRLRSGTDLRQAQAALGVTYVDGGWTLYPVNLAAYVTASWLPTLRAMLFAAATGLAICLANASILYGVSQWRRRGEYAMRAALGASRRQLAADTAIEWSVVGVVALLLIVAVARAVQVALVTTAPSFMPGLTRLPPIADVVLSAIMCVLGMAGLGSVIQVGYTGSQATAKALRLPSSRTSLTPAARRTLHGLVVVQVGATGLALFLATLTVLGLRAEWRSAPRYGAADTTTARLTFRDVRYASAQAKQAYTDSAVERLRTLPQVRGVAVASIIPFDRFVLEAEATAPNRAGVSPVTVRYAAVSPEFFRLLDLAPAKGRVFVDADDVGAPTVFVITASAAKALWPGSAAVGQRLAVRAINPSGSLRGDVYRDGEVVGVVPDPSDGPSAQSTQPTVYCTYRQHTMPFVRLVVKGQVTAPPERSIREALRSVDPGLLVDEVRTLREMLLMRTERLRFVAVVTTAFAVTGLVFVVTGTYGVLRRIAIQRAREFAIRSALGASPRDLRRAMVMQGAGLVAGGLLVASVLLVTFRTLAISVTGPPSTAVLRDAILIDLALIAVPAVTAIYSVARQTTRVDVSSLLKDH